MDTSKVHDVVISGIDRKDYPDFCDAYIAEAWVDDRELTVRECEQLQEDNPDWFYEKLMWELT